MSELIASLQRVADALASTDIEDLNACRDFLHRALANESFTPTLRPLFGAWLGLMDAAWDARANVDLLGAEDADVMVIDEDPE